MVTTYRPNRLKEYTSGPSRGRATGRNLKHWAARASEHSPQHSLATGGGCETPEANLDPPSTPSTGKPMKLRSTSAEPRGHK